MTVFMCDVAGLNWLFCWKASIEYILKQIIAMLHYIFNIVKILIEFMILIIL